MFASIWSSLGWGKEPSPSPPPVTITAVRIPADGSPAHLLSLTTISTASTTKSTDEFLFHVPDLRQYWNTEQGWKRRDLHRLDIQQQHSLQQEDYLQQQLQLWKKFYYQLRSGVLNSEQQRHVRQQLFLPQERHLLQQHHLSCIGTYYVYASYDVDDLPNNSFVPAWISGGNHGYNGDVFLVKIAPHEFGENGWAAYKDIVPDFLDLLVEKAL
jgi:hypothetical protein